MSSKRSNYCLATLGWLGFVDASQVDARYALFGGWLDLRGWECYYQITRLGALGSGSGTINQHIEL